MNKIAVFTSGGDSPGMNACVRAVVRTALNLGKEIYGIQEGYKGMIKGDITKLSSTSVAHIIHRGGTILKTARCKEFRTKTGREEAYKQLNSIGVEGLIAIGGDGTFTGAEIFYREFNIPTIGLPGTIDNDLYGTDSTIGYDSALNTVIEAVDKIRDTAASHSRLFVVEVMGKDAGFIALRSGIASGAEDVLIPEVKSDVLGLIDNIKNKRRLNKTSGIIIVAEGDETGGGKMVSDQLKKALPNYDIKLTILGHIQRGGSPSAYDRVLASKLGYNAVNYLLKGKTNMMLGIKGLAISETKFEKAIKHNSSIKKELLNLVKVLAS